MTRVAEEGSGAGGREGCSGSAEGQDRTAWEEVGKVSRVAEEGSDKGEGRVAMDQPRDRTGQDSVGGGRVSVEGSRGRL